MEEKTILIVDDTETNLDTLVEVLGQKYDVLATTDGKEALDILKEEKVDLILLDIVMPNLNGFEVCKIIKNDHKLKHIPVIFITANSDEDSIEKAYEVGGVDYIIKPFRIKEVLSRVATHLSLYEYQHKLEEKVEEKTKELQTLNMEIIKTQEEIIYTMGEIAELRSKETGNHVKRVALYSEIIAKEYGLSEKEINLVKKASPMHDIGKVAIPDAILHKPARLTKEEFEIMKTHATLGYEMLKHSNRELIKSAAIIAYTHHEKFNGKGYPRGLKGEEIPIFGRIVAVADVFDALGSDRVYKKAWEDEKIFELFHKEKGEHFDPDMIDIFFKKIDEILKIRDSLKD